MCRALNWPSITSLVARMSYISLIHGFSPGPFVKASPVRFHACSTTSCFCSTCTQRSVLKAQRHTAECKTAGQRSVARLQLNLSCSQDQLWHQGGQRTEQEAQWLTSGSWRTFLEKLSQSGATLFMSSFIMMQKPPTYTQRSSM